MRVAQHEESPPTGTAPPLVASRLCGRATGPRTDDAHRSAITRRDPQRGTQAARAWCQLAGCSGDRRLGEASTGIPPSAPALAGFQGPPSLVGDPFLSLPPLPVDTVHTTPSLLLGILSRYSLTLVVLVSPLFSATAPSQEKLICTLLGEPARPVCSRSFVTSSPGLGVISHKISATRISVLSHQHPVRASISPCSCILLNPSSLLHAQLPCGRHMRVCFHSGPARSRGCKSTPVACFVLCIYSYLLACVGGGLAQ